MSRYIDIEPYEKDGWYLQKIYYDTYGAGIKTTPLKSVPTADAEPRKHGRWIPWNDSRKTFECSNCRAVYACTEPTEIIEGFQYCPNCGSRMDGMDGGENG